MSTRRVLDVEQASALVGLSKWTLYRARKLGQLRAGPRGHKFRVTEEELLRWNASPLRSGRSQDAL